MLDWLRISGELLFYLAFVQIFSVCASDGCVVLCVAEVVLSFLQCFVHVCVFFCMLRVCTERKDW